jgi:hypothetical protein
MIENNELQHNLIINSETKRWREQFSNLIGLPAGFIPKLDSDDNVRLTLTKEADLFQLSINIIPVGENPSMQKIHEVELSGSRLNEIIRTLGIVVMTDAIIQNSVAKEESSMEIHNPN